MLVTLKEILKTAEAENTAIGAFNCSCLECIAAVTEAAVELNRPVIIQYATVHSPYITLDEIAPIMKMYAERASVPVCTNFDHGASVEDCKKAIDLGFSSVMYDASAKPYEENIAGTKEVVEYAAKHGVSVEAELGHVFTSMKGTSLEGSDEDMGEINPDTYVNPDEADDFISRTGIDAFAFAFGTAHGVYPQAPQLDFDRISAVKNNVNIPLVMHGGSGLSDDDYREAIKRGIRKINFYTYMSMRGAAAVENYIKNNDTGYLFFHDIMLAGKNGMKERAKEAISLFSMK